MRPPDRDYQPDVSMLEAGSMGMMNRAGMLVVIAALAAPATAQNVFASRRRSIHRDTDH